MTTVGSALARALWHRLESLNAVAYFAPECREAPRRLGLEGFWSGYFACRAAPMGPVTAGVVEATLFNFHPRRVRRAIPQAWDVASPETLIEARAEAAAAALRRLLPAGLPESVAAEALPHLEAAVDHGSTGGRPLFAANRDVGLPDDPVAALWQRATTLREHRGDSHVALLVAEGLDGCEAHVLFAAREGVPAELFQQSRGWSPDEWNAAVERLCSRGLVEPGGAATEAGRTVRAEIERRTDELAAAAYAPLRAVDEVLDALEPASLTIAAAGEVAFPNPMGLPRPEGWERAPTQVRPQDRTHRSGDVWPDGPSAARSTLYSGD